MNRIKGISMIVLGSMFWGASGPMIQWLLAEVHMTATFLLAVRLIIAGLILLLFLLISNVAVFAIWKDKNSAIQMLLFSVIGMLGLQLSFTKTIEESNAVLATLMQFVAPILLVIYIAVRNRQLPQRSQVIGIIGTFFGMFLLLTNGSLSSLLVSEKALFWGTILAFTYAFYTIYPARLMKKWGVLIVVSWGILLSGVEIAIISRVWQSNEWSLLADGTTIVMLIFLILFGTAAYVLFLSSLKYLSPVETSVLSSVEPLTATIISMIWLSLSMFGWQYVGLVFMVIFVAYMSVAESKKIKLIKIPD